jgi:hypothetical protein
MRRIWILGIAIIFVAWVVMAGAALAYTYHQTTIETIPGVVVDGSQILQPIYNETTATPYKTYTYPLIIVSITLFVSGIVLILVQSINRLRTKIAH